MSPGSIQLCKGFLANKQEKYCNNKYCFSLFGANFKELWCAYIRFTVKQSIRIIYEGSDHRVS